MNGENDSSNPPQQDEEGGDSPLDVESGNEMNVSSPATSASRGRPAASVQETVELPSLGRCIK